MSGFGTILSSAAGAVAGITSILFGGEGAIVLGDVTFSGFEVPERLSWGGKQRIEVHKLPGGVRVFDVLGRDDDAISWKGVLMQDSVRQRAQLLDEMRVSGEVVPLSWGTHLFSVVVSAFKCEDMPFRSEYTITCEVLRDEAADQPDAEPSPLEQLRTDVNSAFAAMSDPIGTFRNLL